MMQMPGHSHKGPLPPLSRDQAALRDRLRGHVTMLAGEIGERNVLHYRALQQAAQYVTSRLRGLGLTVREEPYLVEDKEVVNIEAELKGTVHPEEIVVIGAHYDSVSGTAGANDNGSGVAALLELARLLKETNPARTVRLVAFVNEEPPWFQTEAMGSLVYARRAKKRGDKIVAMLSLETIGCYSDLPKSQHYPAPFGLFYPDTGNFIAFVGNFRSRSLLRRAIGTFRATTPFPSEGVAAPEAISGIGWSDHWSFWQEGYPALMVTDTAPFRYLHYHEPEDTPEKLDYERMARVVDGLVRVATELAASNRH
ncbi:MAG TPA: M28 family peptidase [Geobacteraceae bacterium]|nr:M28 family peptidase [Geobacteraceae bacterium]